MRVPLGQEKEVRVELGRVAKCVRGQVAKPHGAEPVPSATNQVRIAATASAEPSAEFTANAGIARKKRNPVTQRFWRWGSGSTTSSG